MLQAKLIVVSGEVKTREVTLKLPALIGRGKEASLKIPMALVSRKHCEIRERDGRLFIRDLGSLNGTFVNNYKITTEQPLLPGEQFTVGSLTFRAEYQLHDSVSSRPQPAAQETTREPQPASRARNSRSAAPANSGSRSALASTERPASQPLFDSTIAGTLSVQVSPGQQVTLGTDSAPPGTSSAQKQSTEKPPVEDNAQPRLARPRPAAWQTGSSSGAKPAKSSSAVLEDFPLEMMPEKSISLSSLEELPQADKAEVSFIGSLNLGSAVSPTSEIASSVHINLGEADASVAPAAADDSRLDSFLREIGRSSE